MGNGSHSRQKPPAQNYDEKDGSDAELERPRPQIEISNLEGDVKITGVRMHEEKEEKDPAGDLKTELEKFEA